MGKSRRHRGRSTGRVTPSKRRRGLGRAGRIGTMLGAGALLPITPHLTSTAVADHDNGDTWTIMADPHTMMGPDLADYTFASTYWPPQASFGTTAAPRADEPNVPTQGPTQPWPAAQVDGCPALDPVYHVPVIRTNPGNGSGSTLGWGSAYGDVLPYGPRAEFGADPCSPVWAPSVINYGGKHLMHYTAMKLKAHPGEPDQMCIYRAASNYVDGPYKTLAEAVCPGDQEWAIDPHTFRAEGGLYMSYRNDAARTAPGQTAISVVQLDDNGAVAGTPHTAFQSDQIDWAYAGRTGTNVVENPAMVQRGERYYLFYSGNDWATSRYGTGIADCGTSPLPASRCKPLDSTTVPYFGHSSGDLPWYPLLQLPGNKTGPGGMTPYKSADGWRATWHWAHEPLCSPHVFDPFHEHCGYPDRPARNAPLQFPDETVGGKFKVG